MAVKTFLLGVMLTLTCAAALRAQGVAKNKYGLTVINDVDHYREKVRQDSTQRLVDLNHFLPSLKFDIRYATGNNFMKEAVYRLPKAFVRLPVAQALQKVQEELAAQGLGLKIYDAYRPYSVTVYFYDRLHDSVFVAVPWRGSRHNRGSTVDLTLISLKTGKEIKMPTAYDALSAKAHVDYQKLPLKTRENRDLLIQVMQKHGFKVYAPEWWHFDFQHFDRYDLMDISFEELLQE